MKTTVRLVAAAAALLCASPLVAQTAYPTHPVRMIVPFAAGGPTDVIARVVAQKLSESLRQQFYVENLPGAGGNTGTATAAKSPPDGYTVLVVSTGFIVNPSLYAKGVPYDPVKNFAPVTLVAGRRYYIEAVLQAGKPGSHLSIAWQIPGHGERELISGDYLSPLETN